MIPPIEEIVARRHRARSLLRWARIALFMAAAQRLLSWVIEGIIDLDLFDIFYYIGRITWGIVFAGTALLIGFTEARLARWLVPLPDPGCPRCGYALRRPVGDRCPECGLAISAALGAEHDPGAAPAAPVEPEA